MTKEKKRERGSGRGGQLWNVVNVTAWAGWIYLLYQVLSRRNGAWTADDLRKIIRTTLILEGVCIAEVIQMAIAGSGNVPLGITLHYTRVFVAYFVWPVLLSQGYQYIIVAILLSWAVTEVCRYPCYICKLAKIEVRSTPKPYVQYTCYTCHVPFLSFLVIMCRLDSPSHVIVMYPNTHTLPFFQSAAASFLNALRYAIPILTFPLGAGGEALACYYASKSLTGIFQTLALVQVAANVVGGAFVYPGMVSRGIRFLGGKGRKGPTRKEKET